MERIRQRPSRFELRRSAISWLLAMVVGLAAPAVHAQRTFTIQGLVEAKGHENGAKLTVTNARVWVMKGPQSKEPSHDYGDSKNNGRYAIFGIEQGDYGLVACDSGLVYQPKRPPTHVPSDNDVPFDLGSNDPTNGVDLQFRRPTVVYFRHLDTGCQPPPVKADKHGEDWIVHASMDSGAFDEQYAYCAEGEAGELASGTYDKCLVKQTEKGKTLAEVEAAIGDLQKAKPSFLGLASKDQETYIYAKGHWQITVSRGTVTAASPMAGKP